MASMAEGGEVPTVCGLKMKHEPECEYYAEGGDVEIDQSAVVPDVAEPKVAAPDEIDQTAVVPDEIDQAAVVPDTGEYGTTGQKILTGVEGLAEGIAGPVATGVELGLSKLGVPGLSAEDIRGRQKENPLIHGAAETAGFAGSLMVPGVGAANVTLRAANLATKGITVAKDAGMLAKLGAGALKAAVQGGMFSAGDEASKAMLGEYRDLDAADTTSAVLLHVGAGGLLNMGVSGTFNLVGGIKSKAQNMAGVELRSYLAGVGLGIEEKSAGALGKRPLMNQVFDDGALDEKSLWRGVEIGKNLTNMLGGKVESKLANEAARLTGSAVIGSAAGPGGVLVGSWAGKKAAEFVRSRIGPYMTPFIGKLDKHTAPLANFLVNNPAVAVSGASAAYIRAAMLGESQARKGVEAVFRAGSQSLLNANKDEMDHVLKLQKYMDSGGLDKEIWDAGSVTDEPTPWMAEGGEVRKPKSPPGKDILAANGIDTALPEHNLLMQSAKSKAVNYLNALRPSKDTPKLAFDANPDTRRQMKSYDAACRIAVNPMSVLEHIAKGTLDAEHLVHLNSMYPGAQDYLKKKMVEQITQDQMDGKKPSFKVRQSLSFFMGVPLESSFDQKHMAAAQATFIKAPQQPQGGGAKFTELTKSDNRHATGPQARELRQQKG
jgi:hypothetical protein